MLKPIMDLYLTTSPLNWTAVLSVTQETPCFIFLFAFITHQTLGQPFKGASTQSAAWAFTAAVQILQLPVGGHDLLTAREKPRHISFLSLTSRCTNHQLNSQEKQVRCRGMLESKKTIKIWERFADFSEESSRMSPHIRSVASGHSEEWRSLSIIKSSLMEKKKCKYENNICYSSIWVFWK